MKILIACEESQTVCKAFREKGHEAYSCDIQECSGGHPEWHIQDDVLKIINGNCSFITMSGEIHNIWSKWDLIIAHPPCTHLAVSGARHFERKRKDGSQKEAIEFFCKLLNADCEKIAVENPVCIISGEYVLKYYPEIAKKYGLPIKPMQTIQPYEFGHPVSKKTCFWLKGLQKLTPTNIVEPDVIHSAGKSGGYSGALWHAVDENGKIIAWNDPRTAKIRSKTFQGVAKAMAEQWG